MRFYTDGFQVDFYYKYNQNSPIKVGHDALASHSVECEIYDCDFDELVSIGVAFCSVNDKYDQQTGEEIALERALSAAGFVESYRELFWNSYYGD